MGTEVVEPPDLSRLHPLERLPDEAIRLILCYVPPSIYAVLRTLDQATKRLIDRNSPASHITCPSDTQVLRRETSLAVRKVTVDLDSPEWEFYFWNVDPQLSWIKCHSLLFVTSRIGKRNIGRTIIKALNDFRELRPVELTWRDMPTGAQDIRCRFAMQEQGRTTYASLFAMFQHTISRCGYRHVTVPSTVFFIPLIPAYPRMFRFRDDSTEEGLREVRQMIERFWNVRDSSSGDPLSSPLEVVIDLDTAHDTKAATYVKDQWRRLIQQEYDRLLLDRYGGWVSDVVDDELYLVLNVVGGNPG